jgi:hypothetical protein
MAQWRHSTRYIDVHVRVYIRDSDSSHVSDLVLVKDSASSHFACHSLDSDSNHVSDLVRVRDSGSDFDTKHRI